MDPNVLYSLVEGFYNKLDFPQVDLFPFCSGGLIECLYVINIILCFESMVTTNETISIPIELYLDEKNNETIKSEINNEINNEIKNEINNENMVNTQIKDEKYIDINSINDEETKNGNDTHDFEVLEKEDFIKALNNISNKK